MIGIYKITSPSGRIYVGQSIDLKQREYQYKSAAKNNNKKHLGPKLYNSFTKYGFSSHKFEIIELCCIEELNERETYWKQYYIDQIGWKRVLFCELYDLGGGPKSEITKKKISESNRNKIVSFETRAKRSLSLLGGKRSKETRNKMSKAAKGKPKSKTHVKNMMKNRKGIIEAVIKANSKSINQYDLEGNFIKEWISSAEAKRYYGGDINACCNGRQKSSNGFIWRFK
jgi:group I intron endonuclease